MRSDLLELAAVKGYIRNYISSDMGSSALDKLEPFATWDEARERWEYLHAMLDIIPIRRPAFSPLSDIRPLLDLKKGAVLEGQDLLSIAGVIKDMSRLRADLAAEDSVLSALAEAIPPLDDLAFNISENLLPTGEVSDRKNPALRNLRIRYRNLRATLLEKLENILVRVKSHVMEDIITQRNNRFVIPLRPDYSAVLKGITHDYSGTRQSVYVEPMEVIDDNNALGELKAEIREEEYKVLLELTASIFQALDELRAGMEAYALLDLIHACARWADKIQAVIPVLGDEIQLKKVRHPVLLERLGSRCIPLDIVIPADTNCLILSGPNAGGKTVALKTIGLVVLMAKCGLAIPAAPGSIIPAIGNVWVEMDTSQDITHDLSTFTAHAMALKHIYSGLREGDLVLLDEPGTGTDHDHGGAIAIACIDAYRKRGAYVVATSHAELVKLYGLSQNDVAVAALAFDDTSLRPLYTLQYGIIGTSHAFEILRAIEFPAALIDEAAAIVQRSGNTSLLNAIEDMGKAYELRQLAQAEHAEAERLMGRAAQELREAQQQKLDQALYYRRFRERLDVLARKKPSRQELKELVDSPEAKGLEEVLRQTQTLAAQDLQITAGSKVRLKNTEITGEVLSLGSGSAEVMCGNKRITLDLDQIEVYQPSKPKPASKVRHIKAHAPVVYPIVVVGMHVDEALPVVEQALDKALLSGQDRLEIVHGGGTGALKKAIRSFLKEQPFVRDVADASQEQGGGNMTVVRLVDHG